MVLKEFIVTVLLILCAVYMIKEQEPDFSEQFCDGATIDRYYELSGDMAAYSLATDWDINQVWAVILPFLQKYGKAKRPEIEKIVGNHLSSKQLRRYLETLETMD